MRISSKQFCLEDNTELSESNPGRSLGIYKAQRTAVWKTVPLTFLIPETSSQVTLAALGIGFQPNLAGTLAYDEESNINK